MNFFSQFFFVFLSVPDDFPSIGIKEITKKNCMRQSISFRLKRIDPVFQLDLTTKNWSKVSSKWGRNYKKRRKNEKSSNVPPVHKNQVFIRILM